MKRPNKKDYDFNDTIDGARFASNMIRYCDWLESEQSMANNIKNVLNKYKDPVKDNVKEVNDNIDSKTCDNCKAWNKMPHREGYGFCVSEKWNRHPSYCEDSDKVTEFDMVEITYNPITGKNFRCIHFDRL